jgi:hypothetical protein
MPIETEHSPIVIYWDKIEKDMETFLAAPYEWLRKEFEKTPKQLVSSQRYEYFDTLMFILQLFNRIYTPTKIVK